MKMHIKPNSLDWQNGKIEGFSGKNLIQMGNGGLKLVKVEAHATYPTHLHPNKTEYVYVLEGNPTIKIESQVFEGVKDDFFILPHSIAHSIENNTATECKLLVGQLVNNII